MGQTSVERLHGRLDVLQTSFPPSPSWIQDGDAGNDVIQDLGRFFRPLLRRRRKMAALPLPVAILDDLICGIGNEVIQDGDRKRKGRHLAPPPQWGSKKPPYTTGVVQGFWCHCSLISQFSLPPYLTYAQQCWSRFFFNVILNKLLNKQYIRRDVWRNVAHMTLQFMSQNTSRKRGCQDEWYEIADTMANIMKAYIPR